MHGQDRCFYSVQETEKVEGNEAEHFLEIYMNADVDVFPDNFFVGDNWIGTMIVVLTE